MKFIQILISFIIALLVILPMNIIGMIVVPFGIKYGFKGILWPWGNDDHPDNGGNFAIKNNISPYTWFAIRNPSFNFGKYVLGVVATGSYTLVGDNPIGDTKAEGSYWCYMGWYWEFYYIKAYTIFGKRKCIRLRAGWKLNNRVAGEYCQFVFSPTPGMTYTGK